MQDHIKTGLRDRLIATALLWFLLTIWELANLSCWALLIPFILWVLITKSQFNYLMQCRVCRAKALFNIQSWIYWILTRQACVGVFSVITSTIFAISLSGYVALADAHDAALIVLASVLMLLLYPYSERFCITHVAEEMRSVMIKKIIVIWIFIIMMIGYTVDYYFLHTLPDYLNPSSLNETIASASHQVASNCIIINLFLKSIQEMNAISYFVLERLSALDNGQYWMSYTVYAWLLYFFKGSVVFAAFARVQAELIGCVGSFFANRRKNE